MAEKKRKGAMSAPPPTPPAKRSRKSAASEPGVATQPDLEGTTIKTSEVNGAAIKPKAGRKRAVDFLGDDAAAPAAAATLPIVASKPSKKAKKSTNSVDNADSGVGAELNGASDVVDPASENETSDEDDDQGAALLAGFDSDGEDPAQDQGDLNGTQPIPQFKKTSKKLKQAKEKGSDGPGTVYIGRIPHGFYEKQMKDYFLQFGDITRLRLSRNKRTGASKHFAFIEFASDEVAKIVADTMDNYLMFGHILKCKYAPSESLHPDLWKGADRKYRKIPYDKIERQRLEAPKTQEQWSKKNEKERQKRIKQAEKMKAIGYEYVTPELKDPSDVLDQRKKEQEGSEPAATVTSSEQPNAIAPAPSTSVEEGSTKKAKKTKKAKSEGSAELLTKGNLDARNAGPAAELAKIAQNLEDKKNNVATIDTVRVAGTAGPKKARKLRTESSVLEGSNHGDYDNLSSIPVGIEAAPSHVTDAVVVMPEVERERITTYAGIADEVLKGRKSDRKKANRPDKKRSSREEKAEDVLSSIAAGAVGSSSSREKKEKGKKGKRGEEEQ